MNSTPNAVDGDDIEIGWRWPAGAALMLAEYLVLSLRVDAWSRAGRPYGLQHIGALSTVAVATAVSIVFFRGRKLRADLAAVRVQRVTVGTYALAGLHFASYAALYYASIQFFDSADGTGTEQWALRWLLAVLAVGITFVPLVADVRRLPRFVWTLSPAVGLGLLVGVVAVVFGRASSSQWHTIGHYTLDASGWLLALVAPEVVVEPDEMLFGTPEFIVQVAPTCSGFEGMGLIFALLSGYILVHREELRFPNVLVIVPLGVAAVWVANTARIAVLVMIGTWWSPQVAVGGFHSKAGWVLFCTIAMLTVIYMRRSPLFSKQLPPSVQADPGDEAAPFLLPLLVLIAVSLVTGLFAVEVDYFYGLRMLAAGAVLYAHRAEYAALITRPHWSSIAIGVAVFALWAALVPGVTDAGHALHAEVSALPPALAASWIAVRVLGSSLVVPVVEELAFRGYLLPRLRSAHFRSVPLDRPLWIPIAVSSLAFGFLHGAWVAGTLAGVAYAGAQLVRGRTLDAAVAHAVTNALVSAQVLVMGHWGLWA